MIVCELGAAIASLLIFFSWHEFGTEFLIPFIVANNIRVFFTGMQSGSIQKFGKHYDEKLGLKGSLGFWLNGATNGALLFAGILAVVFFSHLTVELIVAIDFAGFVVNGILLMFLNEPKSAKMTSNSPPKPHIAINLRQYAQLFPALAAFDLILSLALCGANTLSLRLLDTKPELVPLMPAIFGGAAFFTAFLSRWKFSPSSKLLWFSLGISLFAQGYFHDLPYLVLALTIIRNLAYWFIFQAITRELMAQASTVNYSALAAGRNALNIGVLASGEFWVGFMTNFPIWVEMAWRSIIALIPLGRRRKS